VSAGPLSTLAEAVQKGERSAEGVAAESLAAAHRIDAKIGAFLSIDDEGVLSRAREVDRRIRVGERLPLAGVPIAIKDNICVAGARTSCASRILENFVPDYDATVVERLVAAGAVPFGKTNLDEFAMGSSTENSAFHATRNPWDLDRIPGGSSGGSAAAVAARIVPAALGSDTGGSIRQPAACCGVVGFKPGYGRVSRYGLVAFASSLDQIGPLTNSVADAARIYASMAGADARDATSLREASADVLAALERPIRGLKIGVLREAFAQGIDSDVERNFNAALDVFRDEGAEIRDVSVPRAPLAIATYYIVANAEASSNLARYDGVRYGLRVPENALSRLYVESRSRGFGPEVKRRILLGTFALASGYYEAYYGRAMRVRRLLSEEFDRAFVEVDLVATPTIPAPAFRLGEKTEDPLTMYLSDVFTAPANLAGLPAISVPSGFAGNRLPLGLQLMAPRFGEEPLFAAAAAYERATRFGQRRPPASV
jgi:aspartyl-tRNA(Asn)/glutamyl-tRNA(Gln) amidotransferase subunit A